MNFVRLPLKKAYNIRDIGGYPCINKGVTKWKTFLRADSVADLDSEDIKFLLDYGLTSVVDLRSKVETKESPNPFQSIQSVEYINIPLGVSSGDDDTQDLTRIMMKDPLKTMPTFYIRILKESRERIKEIFEFIANQDEGCLLFHCTAGKDRTGVLAMLLLGLCGVDNVDIITNYMTTYQYIIKNPVIKNLSNNYCKEVIYSNVEYIEAAIEYIESEFRGFENYLVSIGIEEGILNNVKAKLVSYI